MTYRAHTRVWVCACTLRGNGSWRNNELFPNSISILLQPSFLLFIPRNESCKSRSCERSVKEPRRDPSTGCIRTMRSSKNMEIALFLPPYFNNGSGNADKFEILPRNFISRSRRCHGDRVSGFPGEKLTQIISARKSWEVVKNGALVPEKKKERIHPVPFDEAKSHARKSKSFVR